MNRLTPGQNEELACSAIPLTQRDQFALAAMQGYLACGGPSNPHNSKVEELLVSRAYAVADAMIRQRIKPTE